MSQNDDGASGSGLDGVDRRLLTLLQGNGRISNAELARQVEMAPSAVLERVRRLEERGIIRGYETRLNPQALGVGLTAFVQVRAREEGADAAVGRAIAALAEVQEVHHVAGDDCYLVKVRVSDTESLGRLLRSRIGALPGVQGTRTIVVLETMKETADLVIAPPATP